jgi:hypothetical protein
MRCVLIAAAALMSALFPGCGLPPPVGTQYSAKIERISERGEAWDFYSPTKGHKPLYCLYLLLIDTDGRDLGYRARVLVQDLYSPKIYGQEGDTVSFVYPGRLPESRDVEFDSLTCYKVDPKRAD